MPVAKNWSLLAARHPRAQPLRRAAGGSTPAHRRAVDARLLERRRPPSARGRRRRRRPAAPSGPPGTCRRRRAGRRTPSSRRADARSVAATRLAERAHRRLTAPATPSPRRRTPGRAPPARPGLMPCPRLAMCPRPPNAASISCVRVSDLRRRRVEPARIEVALERHRAGRRSRRRASAASVCQSTPITSAPVAVGDLLERPARARREGDDRRARRRARSAPPRPGRAARTRGSRAGRARSPTSRRAAPPARRRATCAARNAPDRSAPAARAARAPAPGSCTSSRFAWVNDFEPSPSTM